MKTLGKWTLTWVCPRVAGKVGNPAAMAGDDGCMHAMLLVWPEVHLHHCICVHLEGSTIGQWVCFWDLCHHPVQQMHTSLSKGDDYCALRNHGWLLFFERSIPVSLRISLSTARFQGIS